MQQSKFTQRVLLDIQFYAEGSAEKEAGTRQGRENKIISND